MDGVLVVNKEAGWTSHDVVARVRHLLVEPRSVMPAHSILPQRASCLS